jgi:predicted house-cleaning noncanonical NTP pyrophosphatase (MazG superfamily)
MTKLIRDKIPDIIIASGKKPIVLKATKLEIPNLLKSKLIEEAQEVNNSHTQEEIISELVDVLEVVMSLAQHLHVDFKVLERQRQKKAKERGRFKKGLILEAIK